MSMINDALRRASNTPATEPIAAAGAVPPPLPAAAFNSVGQGFNTVSDFPPLDDQPPAKKTSLPLLLLALFLFCAAAAAGVYLWERSHRAAPTSATKGQLAATTTPAKATETTVTAAPAPAAKPATTAATTAASVAPAARPTPVAAAVTPTAQTAPTAPATAASNVPFPQLRLQSIYYKPASPSVIINGRTLYVNDQVQGVTVAAIDPSSVTLVLSGRTNVLTLR